MALGHNEEQKKFNSSCSFIIDVRDSHHSRVFHEMWEFGRVPNDG